MRILLIVPDRHIAGFIRAGLIESGHDVELTSVTAALAVQTGMAYDAAIVDHGTNPGDALMAVKALREVDPACSVVVLVPWLTPHEFQRWHDHGIVTTLTKPFKFRELLTVLEELTVSKRLLHSHFSRDPTPNH